MLERGKMTNSGGQLNKKHGSIIKYPLLNCYL